MADRDNNLGNIGSSEDQIEEQDVGNQGGLSGSSTDKSSGGLGGSSTSGDRSQSESSGDELGGSREGGMSGSESGSEGGYSEPSIPKSTEDSGDIGSNR